MLIFVITESKHNSKLSIMKLRNLFYLLLAMPLFVAGCSENGEITYPDAINLYPTSETTLSFEAQGGRGAITYNLENAPEGAVATAVCNAEWITDLTSGASITFNVAANKGEARSTKITVVYKTDLFEVAINQAAYDAQNVTFTANYCDGEYYAQSEGSIGYNYYFTLSDLGYEGGYVKANGIYYMLDLYSDVDAEVDEDGYVTVPAGTYTFDAEDTTNPGTIGNYYSAYFVINSTASAYDVQTRFDNATMVVTETGATLTAVIEGNTHVVTYNGALKVYAGADAPIEGGEYVADMLAGDYYGDEGGIYAYDVILTNYGFDEEGYCLPGGYYFTLAFYSGEPTFDAEGYLHIPYGTYEFDLNYTYSEFTIDPDYSYYALVNEEGTAFDIETYYDDVTAVVSETGIVVEAVIEGEEFKVTYNGEPKFYVGATRAAGARKALSLR